MRYEIKRDITNVLKQAIRAINKQRYAHLSEISNRVIHDASIYQDEATLSVAVLVYALGKILARCCERGIKTPDMVPILEKLVKALKNNRYDTFDNLLKEALTVLRQNDKKLKLYLQEVLTKARIKKGSNLHRHGISLRRTAELLDIDSWELQSYIGYTRYTEEGREVNVQKRLSIARKAFS